MDRTVVVQHILPPATLAAVQADADALAECPNYWVPRAVVEGTVPALTAAEQAVQQLHRRLARARLAPHGGQWTGAEYWCQVYEGGRGLGFHFDKDEHVMKEEGRMASPLYSSVLYLTGCPETAGEGGMRQAPTVLIDQWYDAEQCRVLPDNPAWSALVFPRTNQYCLFSGEQAHGVLEAMAPAQQHAQQANQQAAPQQGQRMQQAGEPQQQQAQQQQAQQAKQANQQQTQQAALQQQQQAQQQQSAGCRRRATFLVNWWVQQPEGINRATLEDVQQGRLAAARAGLGCGRHAGGSSIGGGEGQAPSLEGLSLAHAAAAGGAEPAAGVAAGTIAGTTAGADHHQQQQQEQQEEAALQAVEFRRVEAPLLESGSVLPIDELLAEQGVRLSGAGACDAVVLHHPGLTLVPLDEEAVDPQHPLQVLAALLPTSDMASDSSNSQEGSSRSSDEEGQPPAGQ